MPTMPAQAPYGPIALRHAKLPHDGARGYPGQRTWLDACIDPATWAVCIALGRKSGKTTFIKYLFVDEGADPKFAGVRYEAAYMAHQHPAAEDFFDECYEEWKDTGLLKKAHGSQGQDRYILLNPWGGNAGARIWFVSGDAQACGGFYGKNLHRGVIDEAGKVPKIAYQYVMLPMFLTLRGKPLVLGTPYPEGEGFAWFEEYFLKGVVGHKTYDPRHVSFNAPSECNPFNDSQVIADMRADFAGDAVGERCHIDGLFARDAGAVFTNFEAVFAIKSWREEGNRWISQDYVPKVVYCAGIDYGKHGDFTVVTIFRMDTNEQVALMRLQGDYHVQLPHIAELLSRYGDPYVYAEGREGAGLINELLRKRHGQRMREVKWSRGGVWDKESSVLRGVDFFQRGGWKMMDILWQRDEFRLFAKTRIGEHSAGWNYGAPSGKHDDAVAACLYAAYGLEVRGALPEEAGVAAMTMDSPGAWQYLLDTQVIQPGAHGNPFNLRG